MLIFGSMRKLLLATLLVSGCYVEDTRPRYYAGGAATVNADGSADLVEISPGVEVVADYNEPVFYADDYYWAYRGGIWYQSGWYGGGWRAAGYVPGHVSGIRHPEGYARYRPQGYVRGNYSRGVNAGVHYRPAPRASGHGGGARHR